MASKKRAHETEDESDEVCAVEIAPTSAKAEKRILQKYRSSYHEKYSCLVSFKTGDGYVHCALCQSDFSCQHGSLFDCTRHEKSASHKQFESGAKKPPGLSSSFQRMDDDSLVNLERATTRAEAMLCDLLADANLPLSVADKLTKAFKAMFFMPTTIPSRKRMNTQFLCI